MLFKIYKYSTVSIYASGSQPVCHELHKNPQKDLIQTRDIRFIYSKELKKYSNYSIFENRFFIHVENNVLLQLVTYL